MKNNSLLTIRNAELSDAEAISQLITINTLEVVANGYSDAQKQVWIHANTPEEVRQQILNREVFCAVIGERIVGVIGLDGQKVVGLYVAPNDIGQGIGHQLLRYLETYAKASGKEALYLYATPAGLPFYGKNGYSAELLEDVLIDGVVFKETKMHKTLI